MGAFPISTRCSLTTRTSEWVQIVVVEFAGPISRGWKRRANDREWFAFQHCAHLGGRNFALRSFARWHRSGRARWGARGSCRGLRSDPPPDRLRLEENSERGASAKRDAVPKADSSERKTPKPAPNPESSRRTPPPPDPGRGGDRREDSRTKGAHGEAVREARTVLGLAEPLSLSAIQGAHRRLVSRYHPDRFPHDKAAQEMAEEKT